MLYFVLKNTGNTPVCLRVVKLYRRDEEESVVVLIELSTMFRNFQALMLRENLAT